VIHALILFMLRTASAKTSGLNQRSSGRELSLSKIGSPPRSSFEFARAFATLIRAKVKCATKRQAICTPGCSLKENKDISSIRTRLALSHRTAITGVVALLPTHAALAQLTEKKVLTLAAA
jgi:hypothetical protein